MEFDIEYIKQNFSNHLEVPFNDRIIFSGPFGTGKTYFLNSFFTENSNYNVIQLYPVNYSVASNEDIFELIKFDILFELLGKDVDFDQVKINHLEFFQKFALKNFHSILAPFLNIIPLIGQNLFSIYEKLESLSKVYYKDYDEHQVDDKSTLVNYLQEFTAKKGSILEEDFFTQLICQLVDQLKVKIDYNNNCQTVLIIDDLDRIDPDHIFRILNVLSSHFDKKQKSDNKFNFDKIILVFDQANVRQIFENRYGKNVDFSGYIDKFYSYRVFEFDNSNKVNENLSSVLGSILNNSNNRFLDFKNEKSYLHYNLIYILQALVLSNRITVRRLMKIVEKKIERITNYIIHNGRPTGYSNQNFEIFLIYDFLILLFGSWDELIGSLKVCNDFYDENSIRYISYCLVYLDSDTHNFKIDLSLTFKHVETNQTFLYNTQNWHDNHDSFLCNVDNTSRSDDFKIIKYFPILIDTLLKIKNNTGRPINYRR
jgi:hypothetical protein